MNAAAKPANVVVRAVRVFARCPKCGHVSAATTSDALLEALRDHVRLHGWTIARPPKAKDH